MSVRVTVDRELCTGNEECVRAAPTAFELDIEGIAVPTAEASRAPLEELRLAERLCPVLAVLVELVEE